MTKAQTQTYRPYLAFLLVAIVSNSLFINGLHHWFAHSHDHAFQCDATGSEKHFHGDELKVEQCFVCNFNFSPVEECEISVINLTIPQLESHQNFHIGQVLLSKESLTTFLRGPPTIS